MDFYRARAKNVGILPRDLAINANLPLTPAFFAQLEKLFTDLHDRHVAYVDPAGPANRSAEMKSELAGRFAGCPIRVLVAEDNVVNQKVAIRMLERLGLRADVAANGLETVRMFETLPYDLVFMDCQMPEMDGYEATRRIRRRQEPGRQVAIIAMTADAMEGCREQCLAAGMDDFIAKPVAMKALFEALQKWAPVKQPALARAEQ